MTRRTFAAGLAATAAAIGDQVALEALYGERLPATLRLSLREAGDYRFFELRVYRGENAVHRQLKEVFTHADLRPVVLADLRFLLPFNSLEERNRTWNHLNCDPAWVRIRERVRLSAMTIYRVRQPGGRIFEISL
jgi:hypothetical protein